MGSISSGTINNYGNVLLPAGSNTIDVQALLNSAIAAAQAPLTLLQQEQAQRADAIGGHAEHSART